MRSLSSAEHAKVPAPASKQTATAQRIGYILIGAVAFLVLASGMARALSGISHLRAGISALAAGDPARAVEQLDQCISANNSLIVAYQYRAMANAALHNQLQALSDLNRVLADQPDNLPCLLARAGLYLGQREYDLAAADCDRGIKLRADDGDFYRIRAICFLKEQRFADSVSDCKAYLATSAATKKDRASVLATMAGALAKQGQTDDALKAFSEAIELDASLDFYKQRAALFAQKQKWKEVLTDCNKVLKERPDATAYKLRAEAEQACGLTAAAMHDVNSAVKLDPQDLSLRRQRGRLAASTNDYALAVNDFKAILDAEPGNKSAEEELVAAAKHLPARQTAADLSGPATSPEKTSLASVAQNDSVTALLAVVRGQPTNTNARLKLARLLLSAGHAQDAVDQFNYVSDAKGLGPDDLLLYAEALRAAGNVPKAVSRFEDYLFVRPGDSKARLALIACYKQIGSNDKALAAAREGARRAHNPSDAFQFERVVGGLAPSQRVGRGTEYSGGR